MNVKMSDMDMEFVSELFSKTLRGLPLQRKMKIKGGC